MPRRHPTTPMLFNLNGEQGAPPKVAPSPPSGSAALGPWALNVVHPVECLSAMRQMPANCIDVVVTSPPYWGQRGNAGIGLEEDPRDYVRNLTEVLAEAMRCLKPTGTLWLNLGDSYNT